MICISIFRLLYFEFWISYHIGMTQYGIIIQNIFQQHMVLLHMQYNNLVLQISMSVHEIVNYSNTSKSYNHLTMLQKTTNSDS